MSLFESTVADFIDNLSEEQAKMYLKKIVLDSVTKNYYFYNNETIVTIKDLVTEQLEINSNQ